MDEIGRQVGSAKNLDGPSADPLQVEILIPLQGEHITPATGCKEEEDEIRVSTRVHNLRSNELLAGMFGTIS